MKTRNAVILGNAIIWAAVILALALVFANIPDYNKMMVIVGGGAAASTIVVGGGLRRL